MAITTTINIEEFGQLGGNLNYAIGTVTTAGTYATGGFALDLPSGGADMANIRAAKLSGGGRLLEWDAANQLVLVKAWATAGATVAASEITNGTALAETYRFICFGQ